MRLYGTLRRGTIHGRIAVIGPPATVASHLAPVAPARRSPARVVQPAVQDRPREKLTRHGPGALGDNELLAIILGHGSRELGVLPLATQVLHDVGGLHGLTRAPQDFLRRWVGVGPAQAARILAAIELGRRSVLKVEERDQFMTPQDAAAYLGPKFGARNVEHFGLVLLDARHRVLRTCVLTVGVLDGAPTHPREVFREAVGGGAAAVVLFHNHPSGDPTPSGEDVDLTMRMVAAGEVMGISVLDHVILGNNYYFSFRESRPQVLGEEHP